MLHEWYNDREIAGNVIVKCRTCGYLVSAGYSKNPNFDWFLVGRIMSCFNYGYVTYRPVPACEDYLAEVVHRG